MQPSNDVKLSERNDSFLGKLKGVVGFVQKFRFISLDVVALKLSDKK